jgi:mannosyltransferase OCH1-like enzyme
MVKIIHQTWKDLDPPRDIYRQEWQDSWKRDYPDWEYKFWTDEDNLSFVKNSYPEFFDFFFKYRKRCNKVRFC